MSRSSGLAKLIVSSASLALLSGEPGGALAQSTSHSIELRYNAQSRGAVPIPPAERGLQTVEAESYFKVADEPLVLEGASFDRGGNLLFVDASNGRVLRLAPDRRLTTVVPESRLGASGTAVHKDGRIFIAAVGDLTNGSVRAVDPDGSGMQMIVGSEAGYLPNDLVFDAQGGFYFADSRGSSIDFRGGVYYVSPDFRTVSAVLPRLGMGNGIALSPDGKVLWVVEYGRNALHQVTLADATNAVPFGTKVAYYFSGPAPDTIRVDSDGNVYVAITGQGRVMVFNRNGLPIGQVLLPGRNEGRNLKSTSLVISPDSNDIFIVTSSATAPDGAMIFRAKGFAKGLQLFSHR